MRFRIACILLLLYSALIAQEKPTSPNNSAKTFAEFDLQLAEIRLKKCETDLQNYTERTTEEKREQTVIEFASLGVSIVITAFTL